MADLDGQLSPDVAAAGASAATCPAPVGERERLSSVDTLRGIAVLGILAINIQQMGLPQSAFSNPNVLGDMSVVDTIAWGGVVEFFLQKFMSIFAMLFGAGTILLYTRFESTGRELAPVYFRRMAVLLAIGLVHAYLIWWGDILVAYALCGMLIYVFRRWPPRRLLIVGAIIFLLPAPFVGLVAKSIDYIHKEAAAAQMKVEAGQTLTPEEQEWQTLWSQIAPSMQPSPQDIQIEIDKHRDGAGPLFAHRALMAIMFQTLIFFAFSMWRTVGLMMAGMALMKWGVLSLGRTNAFYARMMLFGLGVGLPLDAFGLSHLVDSQFDPGAMMLEMGVINYVASVFTAAGYIGGVMLLCRSAALQRLRTRFAAVGRMALTNYLMHSVVFTTVFYGYGLGLFGEFRTAALMVLAAGMWAVQLYLSPVWLRHFKFGPVEWLWRSLTYAKRQPMRRAIAG